MSKYFNFCGSKFLVRCSIFNHLCIDWPQKRYEVEPTAYPVSLIFHVKPGPLGQVRDRWLCLGVLSLKLQISSTKLQTNHKSQITNRFKAIVFLFGILNFGIDIYLFFGICYLSFQQSKSPLGITKTWSSEPGFFTLTLQKSRMPQI